MSRPTQDTTKDITPYAYGTITLYGLPFQVVLLQNYTPIRWSYNPITAETIMVWAAPLSLATTQGITIVFFSSGY